LSFTESAEPEFRANPVGKSTDRRVGLGRGAGQKLEHVLHLRHDLESHINARPAREIGKLAAVVEQCLVGPDLDIDRRETFEVSM
jgi:hypothetical protein